MKLSIVLAAFFVSASLCVSIGVYTSPSAAGIEKLKDEAIPVIHDHIQDFDLPDVHGSTQTPIGKVNYDLSNLKITKVDFADSKFEVLSDHATCNIQVPNVHLTMSWHYKEASWPHYSDSGTADVDVTAASILVYMHLVSPSGIPEIKCPAGLSTATFNNMKITVHGGKAWLYDIFTKVFAAQIKPIAETTTATMIGTVLEKYAKEWLSSYPAFFPLSADMTAVYNNVADPVYLAEKGVIVQSAGLVDWDGATVYPPVEPPAMPYFYDDSANFNFMYSSYFVDSVFYSAWKHGLTDRTFVAADVPKTAPMSLNTADFGFVPDLQAAYPNTDMRVNITATTYPKAHFSRMWGATVSCRGVAEFSTAGGQKLFAVDVVGYAVTEGYAVDKTYVSLKFGTHNHTLSLLWSDFGSFDPQLHLNDFALWYLENKMYPHVNFAFQDPGSKLPAVDGFSMVNPKFHYGDNYAALVTDFVWVPPLQ